MNKETYTTDDFKKIAGDIIRDWTHRNDFYPEAGGDDSLESLTNDLFAIAWYEAQKSVIAQVEGVHMAEVGPPVEGKHG